MPGIVSSGLARAGLTSTRSGAAGPAVAASFNAATNMISGAVTNPGGAVSGLTVSVYVDGASSSAGTATTASDGSWSITLSGLTAGAHAFTVKALAPVIGSASGSVLVTASLHTTIFAFGLLGAATN